MSLLDGGPGLVCTESDHGGSVRVYKALLVSKRCLGRANCMEGSGALAE